MAKCIATTKQTGEGGASFEDKVAAYFMTYLLSKRPPLDPSFGTIVQIRFQVRADKWLLDDILLTLDNGTTQRQCAFSIKSNEQFTQTSAPADFVKTSWEQYLGNDCNPFTHNQDRLGLITISLPIETKTNLEIILNKARTQASDELLLRIKEPKYVSNEARATFFSFKCPADLASKHSMDDKNIGEILSHVEHLDFDFEHTSSIKLASAISILRESLISNDLSESSQLWDTLCAIARETKIHGGMIDLRILVNQLKTKFILKSFPDHVSFWEEIRRSILDELALIPDTIAHAIHINRDPELNKIKSLLDKKRIVVILGESGSGKTVIEKHFAQTKLSSGKVIWINKDTLPNSSDKRYFGPLRLITDVCSFIIVDSIDRFSNEMLKSLAALLKTCSYDDPSSPWKFLISCQPEEWSRVQTRLAEFSINSSWITHKLKLPKYDELTPVWDSYPSLYKLAHHNHLGNFLFKPKILDLFARKIDDIGFDETSFNSAFFSEHPVGESHLINWYWENQVALSDYGLTSGKILKSIAAKIADDLVLEVPASEFQNDDLNIIERLIKERLLRKRSDKISFDHDLIAEWTRLKILLDQDTNLAVFLSTRLTSPLWSKALRLLGTYLLETSQGTETWNKLFMSFTGNKDIERIAQDLLLESSIFSSNPDGNLEMLWDELKKDDGKLLNRFLKRFLYSATSPNKTALMVAAKYKDDLVSNIVALYRDPYWFYWIPVIQFLHLHKDDVIHLSTKDIAYICDKWLRFSNDDWPGRAEAACIALELAENALALNMSNNRFYDRDHYSRIAYRAAIASCKEQPQRVKEFVLTAVSRKEPSGKILDEIIKRNEIAAAEEAERKKHVDEEAINKLRAELSSSFVYKLGPTPPPWVDGPRHNVERDFVKVCLESEDYTDTLYPLIAAFPELSLEVILALLIGVPRAKMLGGIDGHSHEEYLGLNNIDGWFPPFYTRGPFLYFLNTHPDMGLSLIIRLINFATERWTSSSHDEQQSNSNITIEFSGETRSYEGDSTVYYWHRNVGNITHIVPSALMALEHWLYDNIELEATHEIAKRVINRILNEGNSVSFIGLLISVGKKYPDLFADQLLQLLSVPEIYAWSWNHSMKNETHQMIRWSFKDKTMVELAQKWNFMGHRKVDLMDLGRDIFLNDESTRPLFLKFRKVWMKRLNNKGLNENSHALLEHLIHWYDISKWKIEKEEDGVTYEYLVPDEINEECLEEQNKLQDKQLLVLLPIRFRRIIDGEIDISTFSPESIWQVIEDVSTIELDASDTVEDFFQKEHAMGGGIAVLYKFFSGWLKSSPDIEKQCIKIVTDLILSPYHSEDIYYEESVAPWVWDSNCAEVMPIIWAEEPNNKLYRRCIFMLATSIHYETVALLFKSASSVRNELGDNFRQLNNFINRWGHYRWKYYQQRYLNVKTFDVNAWLNNEMSLFENGKTPTEQQRWHDIAKDEVDILIKHQEQQADKQHWDWEIPNVKYFDFRLMKAALSWIPPLNQALNPSERAEWINCWVQALSWTLSELKVNRKGEIAGTPSDWDRWLFGQATMLILQMEDSEHPETLWKPILELGAAGHYWVESFLWEFFVKSLGNDVVPDNFIKRWKQMLEYAFASEKWNDSNGRGWFYIYSLWCKLFGMNYGFSELWRENRGSIIIEMKLYYEKWANRFLIEPESIVLFINFLKFPASNVIMLDSLIWLNNISNKADETFFMNRHHDVQGAIASFLELVMKRQRATLNSSSDARESFHNLLRKLIDLQNPHAFEIQQNLAKTDAY